MKNPLITKMVLDAWLSTVKRVSVVAKELTEEQFQQQVAPSQNSGIYLLGHMTAVNDLMLPLLNLGDPIHPQIKDSFIRTRDKDRQREFTAKELIEYWTEINAQLEEKIYALTDDEWFQKHASISEEDFAKEPHRNRLNVIINRTNHMSYHLGQLVFLKNR
ncbi:MAG: putative damage-inducible protein DinB [Bacteroidia bacterium]|jgi:uncharacterized damage-inducible protein DinB